jgi:hypothetical protein
MIWAGVSGAYVESGWEVYGVLQTKDGELPVAEVENHVSCAIRGSPHFQSCVDYNLYTFYYTFIT